MDNKVDNRVLKSIDIIKNNTEEINKTIKSIRVDVNIMRAELKIIKERLEERDKIEKMGGGWWIY